jgi:hypothetical protein
VTVAYVFWHRPGAGVVPEEYEGWLERFHGRLAAVPIAGFGRSYTLRVPELGWLAGGGYEDWYLVADFAALGELNRAAVDAARLSSHDALARTVSGRHGAGGVYGLAFGTAGAAAGAAAGGVTSGGWAGWFGKRHGVGYAELRAELRELVEAGAVSAVWQRQMVLGPAPEFRVEAAGPVQLRGAELAVAVPVIVSG